MENDKKRQVIITKRIAKHGRDTIIVVPKSLSGLIKPGMLTQLTIEILDENPLINEREGGIK